MKDLKKLNQIKHFNWVLFEFISVLKYFVHQSCLFDKRTKKEICRVSCKKNNFNKCCIFALSLCFTFFFFLFKNVLNKVCWLRPVFPDLCQDEVRGSQVPVQPAQFSDLVRLHKNLKIKNGLRIQLSAEARLEDKKKILKQNLLLKKKSTCIQFFQQALVIDHTINF